MKKTFLTLLTVLFAFAGLAEAAHIHTIHPPKLGDTFFMIRYKDGKSELRTNLSDKEVRHISRKHDVKEVIKTDYAQIVASVTQRVYDYHFYFEQFIASNKATDPDGWKKSLDRLMTVFSKDLTSFEAINLFPGGTNSWSGVKDLYTTLYNVYFQGYTLHIAPNVRVIPLCKDKGVQVFVSTGQQDFSRINVNAVPPPQVVTDIGYYNFTMRYEADGVWRFITWQVDNRVQYVDPPLNGSPVIFTPYEEDPKTHCHL